MEPMIQRGRGLTDLIAGKTPTFVDWTTDPTDAANITDGDISTFCTSGDKIASGAWQIASCEYDLGGFYNVLVSGFGTADVTSGTSYVYVKFWDGSAWQVPVNHVISGSTVRPFRVNSSQCSKVLLGITSDGATTITPNIRELNVWRLR